MPPGPSSRQAEDRARAKALPDRNALIPLRSVNALVVAGVTAIALGGCDSKGPLGPPDSYLIFQPDPGAAAPEAPGAAGTAPLRALQAVPVDDPRAMPIHRGAADGFVGELLRTDYLAKELLRSGWQGRAFSSVARARAGEPTVLVLAGTRASHGGGRGGHRLS